MSMPIGTLIAGKYQLQRLLGDGGMGSVYEALHTLLGTRVAVKLLHNEMVRRAGLVERFLQEAKVAAQIRSPHVVSMLDVGQESGQPPYLVMELLEGEPLSSVLERDKRVPEARALELTSQILTALEAAHALGVIHRDLKPENVFITVVAGRPHIKLIDFGIAKLRSTDPDAKNLTVAGTIMGTAEYMAPEQAIRADQVDARADLYSVGVMLYEMLAGTRPIVSDDPRALFSLAERGQIRPLTEAAGSSPALSDLVMRALEFRPDARWANSTEFRLALDALRSGAPAPKPVTAELGAGTMMGAPVPQALALTGQLPRKEPSAQLSGYEPPRVSGTQMAPPVTGGTEHGLAAPWLQPPQPMRNAPMHGPPPGAPQNMQNAPMPGAPMHAHGPPHGAPQNMQNAPMRPYPSAPPPAARRKKGGGGLWIGLVLLLALGGGVVAFFLIGYDAGGGGSTSLPVTPPATTTVAPPSTTTATATPADTTSPLGPLAPVAVGPAPAPQTQPGPKPQSSGASSSSPSATPAASIPPLVFPSTLPPFPSGLPSFPLPTLPSTFPWPPAQ